MITEEIVLHKNRNVSLMAYIQDMSGEFGFQQRPAMLVLPGGGYGICSDREAEPVAMAYLNAGYNAFVLRYTLKNKGAWPLPLEDYEEAMALIEENSEKWHINKDKIAVVGFSAGGHLAACAATMAKHRPKAAILVYAATEHEVLDNCCQPNLPVPSEHVDELTPPCFFVAARDDRLVPMENTLNMELALTKQNITYESHIYSYGGHGFSIASANLNSSEYCPRLPDWVSYSVGWLDEVLGKFNFDGVGEPAYEKMISGDRAKALSVMATLGHIRKQPDTVQKELGILYDGISSYAAAAGFEPEKVYMYLNSLTVKEILVTLQVSGDVIEELDRRLRRYPNIIERTGTEYETK